MIDGKVKIKITGALGEVEYSTDDLTFEVTTHNMLRALYNHWRHASVQDFKMAVESQLDKYSLYLQEHLGENAYVHHTKNRIAGDVVYGDEDEDEV